VEAFGLDSKLVSLMQAFGLDSKLFISDQNFDCILGFDGSPWATVEAFGLPFKPLGSSLRASIEALGLKPLELSEELCKELPKLSELHVKLAKSFGSSTRFIKARKELPELIKNLIGIGQI